MNREKQKRNIRKSLELKKRLAEMLGDERLRTCARCKTLKCHDCEAMSVKHLQWQFCSRRYCPVCQKIQANKRSKIIAQSSLDLMKQYEASGTPIIPVLITLTIPHNQHDSLRSLLLIISKAFKMLKQGGDKKTWVRNRRKGILPFWRKYFVGETFSLEMPYAKNSGWHPHYHILALRYSHLKVPIGVHQWTGALTNTQEGLRSEWHKYLQRVWNQSYESYELTRNCDSITREYPVLRVDEGHIHQARKKISESTLYQFPNLFEDDTLSHREKQEKQDKLLFLRQQELQKLEEEKVSLLGTQIAALADIRSLYYFDKENNRSTPLTWFLKQNEILNNIRID